MNSTTCSLIIVDHTGLMDVYKVACPKPNIAIITHMINLVLLTMSVYIILRMSKMFWIAIMIFIILILERVLYVIWLLM